MDAQKMLDMLMAALPVIIPLLAATGLLGFIAGHIERGVRDAKKAAKASPSKVDDVVIDLIDDPLLQAAHLLRAGRVEPALQLVEKARTIVASTGAKR